MIRIGSCSWPVWRTDDFTPCFLHDYLRVLLPSSIIAVSFFILAAQSLQRAVRLKRAAYQSISADDRRNSASHRTDLPPEEEATEDEEEDDDLVSIHGGRLALHRTNTKGSIVQADKPPGQTLSVVIEELAICGLVAVNAIALASDSYGSNGRRTAITALTAWLYVLILASLRLFLGNTQWRVPRLWNHTASIYMCQWIFNLAVFRSVLVHPSSRLTQILIIVEFSLTSLLFGMAITTRKGNKTILLEWEDGIPPSRENLASLFSHYTFSWVDSIVWEGYKEPMEMERVWNLLPKDKAANILGSYRQKKKTTSLSIHLLKYFKRELIIQAIWAIAGGLFTFVPTILLKAILEYVEDPSAAPRNVLWLYVCLLPIADVLRSIGDAQALWIGRKICINIRAILVGEIYAKALRRKAAVGKDSELGADKKEKEATGLKGFYIKVKRLVGLRKKEDKKQQDAEAAEGGAKDENTDEQATTGTIINLMSVDSFKTSEVTAYLHFLVGSAPTQLIVAVYLLYLVMGLSAIPGFIVMAMLLPINIAFGKAFNSSQKKIMRATDKRIHTTNEVLQNIRIVKYFAWEERFDNIVDEKRRAELKALRQRYLIWAAAVGVWNAVPLLITVGAFMVYTMVEKKPLYPSVAFTAISLFQLLRFPLDQLGDMIAHVQEAHVSINRIEEFLAEEETEKFEQLGLDNVDETGTRTIGFRDATFIWGGKDVVADDGSMAFRLLDINVNFEIAKLNVVTGPTGSGKTSLLMALLGEMTMLNEGRVFLPGGRSREDVRVDPDTGLAETCAYVAQQAWLVNASIKENILFSTPFEETRYRDVIVACALERDLEILDNADETLVGEKGITLSGGQKQRISLARAVYSNSKHLLLDDCLSAVDSHTANWIFNNCIRGPLMRGRTCILVTHNIPLCVPHSDFVIIMAGGRIQTAGTPQDLIASGKLGEDLLKSRPGSADVSRIPSRVPSSVGESGDTLVDNGGAENGLSKPKGKGPTKQDAMDEGKATGAVEWPVIMLYLSSMGHWWFWAVAALVFVAQQAAAVISNLWVKEWSNQYTEAVSENQFGMRSIGSTTQWFAPTHIASIATYAKPWWLQSSPNSTILQSSTALEAALKPEVDVQYYIIVLAIISLASALTAFIRDLWIFFGSLTASLKLHKMLMHAVMFARFKFFDVTPLGQMMNRFSKDLEAVDQEVAPIAIGVISCAMGLLTTILVIAFVTPGFLIAGVFITVLYFYLGKFYLASSRDLKRLESVQRSPIFQQFGETLSGVTTIRAYGDERRFVRDNLSRINAQNRPFIFLWAANRWLAFRTDVLGDLVAFFAGVFVILSLGYIDAGSAGLSLSYAISFSESILWLVRLYAMNEQNHTHVQRLKEYLEVEQEADAVVEWKNRPANWPSEGSVEFINYSTRYRKELEPVLNNLTFKIASKEKVGIVGRTGAGKSSLALAIFRALEADDGRILIDDVDIGRIGLRDLREAITIVPQEPTLFTGTIRSNLDPFDGYTDEQIYAALRRVQLISPHETTAGTSPPSPTTPAVPNTPVITVEEDGSTTTPAVASNKNVFLNLSSRVAESGSNLSQGQRQLLCLARAMLKNPSVLVMDEATASIDYATDSKIQETIRELESTIITIAHRLASIADYDKVLVLDKGCVVEYGHPWELMKKEGGTFKAMCDASGDSEALAKAAKRAYQAKHVLIDVDEGEDQATGEQEGTGLGVVGAKGVKGTEEVAGKQDEDGEGDSAEVPPS